MTKSEKKIVRAAMRLHKAYYTASFNVYTELRFKLHDACATHQRKKAKK